MEAKKNPKYSISRRIPMFRNLGLTISLLLVIAAFEWPASEHGQVIDLGQLDQSDFEEIMDVPPTDQPPPPKPTVQIKEIIEVPNEEIIEHEIEVVLDVEMIEETTVEEITFAFTEVEEETVEEVFVVVEEMPQYPGGFGEFYLFMADNLNYPPQATRMEIEGRVYVEFTVDQNGALDDIRVVKGIGAGCDEEAVRVMKLVPKFIPGKQRGKPVKVRMVLPIYFKMADWN
jgi:protein TonB